jgi:hypothetical protein
MLFSTFCNPLGIVYICDNQDKRFFYSYSRDPQKKGAAIASFTNKSPLGSGSEKDILITLAETYIRKRRKLDPLTAMDRTYLRGLRYVLVLHWSCLRFLSPSKILPSSNNNIMYDFPALPSSTYLGSSSHTSCEPIDQSDRNGILQVQGATAIHV